MKRFESANIEKEQPSELRGPLPKNYKRAKKAEPIQRSLNEGIEFLYHDLLGRFKKLFGTLSDPKDRTYLEVNNKLEPIDPDGMFTFTCSHFRYHLRCSYADKYEIHYQFHNCPFEQEIRAWFKRALHSTYTFESNRHEDYAKFWQGVLDFQPKDKIIVLDYVAP